MATIRIKTPQNNVVILKKDAFNRSRVNAIKATSAYTEELDQRVSKIVLEKMSQIKDVEINRQISIMATFFQRVVARTPIDEKYKITYTRKDGTTVTKIHEVDEITCQNDWYITDGKVKVTAEQMKAVDDRLFWNVNDKYSVEQIKKILKEKFHITSSTQFEVGNDNPHFKLLEEGNERWKNDGLTAGKDWRNKPKNEAIYREHGVKNMHSIQAPVGMWRISLAELELMKRSSAISPLTSRYRAQAWRTMNKVPNRAKLMEFARLLKSKRNIAWKDIEAYLEKY